MGWRHLTAVLLTGTATLAGGIGAQAAPRSAASLRLLPGRQALAAPASACPKAIIYGVAGSGEAGSPSGMGTTVDAVVAQLKADLGTSVPTGVVPVRYPAVSILNAIDDGLFNGVNYPASRARGITALGGLLTRLAGDQTCPATAAVLVGYSQGADVIGAYLDGTVPAAVRRRIAAVALLGDPRFNPADAQVDAGSFNPGYGPIFGKFGVPPPYWGHPELRRPDFPAPFASETISACDKGDPICNYSWSNAVGCIGLSAWQSFVASILAHTTVPVPAVRASCAHLHYLDAGRAITTAGARVTATAVAGFLATKVLAATSRWAAAQAPVPAAADASRAAFLVAGECPARTSCTAIGGYDHVSDDGQGGLLLAGTGSSWHPVSIPLPGNPGSQVSVFLDGMTCPLPSSCTAVGYYYSTTGGPWRGLILTGSGTSWKAIAPPLPAGAAATAYPTLSAVACSSASACIAVGNYADSAGGNQGLLLTGSGTAWKASKAPLPPGAALHPNSVDLSSVTCPAPGSCAVAGDYENVGGGPTTGIVLTGWGSWWHVVKPPQPAGDVNLLSVSCATPAKCAVAGADILGPSTAAAVLLAGAGTSWQSVKVPLPAGVSAGTMIDLASVSCLATEECVAVGSYGSGGHGVLLIGIGASWTAIRAPLPAGAGSSATSSLSSIDCVSAAACVAVGLYTASAKPGAVLVVASAGARWIADTASLPASARPANGFSLSSVACAVAAGCLSVGFYADSAGDNHGLILRGPG